MNPDKKYMTNSNNSDIDDLNLVPFNSSINSSNMPMGWIPIFPFNNLNNLGNTPMTLPNMYPNSSNPTQSIPSNTQSTQNNTSSLNNQNYPNDENIENLYSYSNSNSNSSNGNSNNTSSPNISRSENISEVLRNYTADLDENIDLCRHCLDKRIDKIYDKIQEKDPELISMLVENYKIPCPIAKIIIRNIIKLTLKYCKKAGD